MERALDRVHLFLWEIFNVVRNLDLLRQWRDLKRQHLRAQSGGCSPPFFHAPSFLSPSPPCRETQVDGARWWRPQP